MVKHNDSGKWLRWSEAQAAKLLARGQTLVVHTFPAQQLQCIWWS